MNENQIDRYLLNQMTPEERKAFEARMESDQSLAQEVNIQREVLKDIEGIGRIELKSKLKQIHQDLYSNSAQPKSNVRRLFYRVAAAAIFLGVLTFGWWSMQQAPNNAQLFAQNFEPFELSLNHRSQGDISLAKIESVYDEGRYDEAIIMFQEALTDQNIQSSQILLGLGICYLQTNQPKKAIAQFDQILSNKDFNYEDEAQWYLGLTYLKLNDLPNAKKHMNMLASDLSRDHHEAAQELLSQLKKK